MSNGGAAQDFLRYARGRLRLLQAGGALGLALGVAGAAVAAGAGRGWSVAVAFVGALLLVAAWRSARLLGEGRAVLAGPARAMVLATWPYRSVRSPTVNRVLVTLDLPGSVDRTPLAEVPATWFTPGTANRPSRPARVFGTVAQGRPLFVVGDDGSCYLGRVRRCRADAGGG